MGSRRRHRKLTGEDGWEETSEGRKEHVRRWRGREMQASPGEHRPVQFSRNERSGQKSWGGPGRCWGSMEDGLCGKCVFHWAGNGKPCKVFEQRKDTKVAGGLFFM